MNAARSSVSQWSPEVGVTVRGAGSPSEHDRCISHAMSSAVAGTASSPARDTSASTWAISDSSAASSAVAAEGTSRPRSGAAPSSQRSTTERPETSTPTKTSLSDIDRPMRWRCSPSRKPSHDRAPATSGSRPGALWSNVSAHNATG